MDLVPNSQNVSQNAPALFSVPPEVGERIGISLKQTTVRQDDFSEKGGKRWVRRRDNSQFVANPHIVRPTIKDFSIPAALPRTTFPKPLPPYISRHLSAPSASSPSRDPASANAGRYSLSLKGVRRELRRSGPRSERIVIDIEQELTQWLHSGGILLDPDSRPAPLSKGIPGKPLGSSNSILEVARSPTELIWRIDEDYPRFLLHCVARFHGVVSFSKTAPDDSIRLTHLLRPNVTRPDFVALRALDTPPASDLSDALSIVADTDESDAASEQGYGFEPEGGPSRSRLQLSALPEEKEVSVHRVSRHQDDFQETGSSVDGEHEDEESLSASIGSLTLAAPRRDWESVSPCRAIRAASPSRSPRRTYRQSSRRVPRTFITDNDKLGFWQYVFG